MLLDWTPDKSETGQIWMLVEKMRELGWLLDFVQWNDHYSARFTKMGIGLKQYLKDTNPCLAILKAARATEVDDGR